MKSSFAPLLLTPAMPPDAPDEAAGYAFMNYLLRPEVMAGVSNFVHYANGNVAGCGMR
ncbi:Putrescine-binding periplasmic protein precursor [compost metagenome]